ncbi:MAG: ribonucleoside-triphosphate reductase [bacterium]|nr:ribonucleoside-triphosphate reductase [bacterium]
MEEVKKYADSISAELSEKKGVWTLTKVVAERKAFLSKKKLEYIAKFRFDDENKEIRFTEMLKESGSGISSGDMDDMSPGFGFKAGTYKTGMGGREGSIKEQSNLFGKDYSYEFKFEEIRAKIEEIAKNKGYDFKYQITSKGL